MNTTTKILIGIGLVSVSGAIFYFYKNYSDESEKKASRSPLKPRTNNQNENEKVDTATSIDDKLMNPQDQRLLDNLERYSDQKLDGGYRGSGRVPNTDFNPDDYEYRPAKIRPRTDIGDRRSSGTRSSLNPRTNTRSSRTRSSRR